MQADGVIDVRDERAQVAIVDADKSRIQGEDAVEIPGVIEFDEGGHPVGEDRFVQIREFRAGEAFGDEQNGIGSGRAGFDDLVLIEDEILSQHRDRDFAADRDQKIEMPLKEVLVCQDAETVRAALLVDFRDGDGIEVGADESGGGRRFLDFGDESDRGDEGDGVLCLQAGDEITDGRGIREKRLEFGEGHARFGRGDFGSLVGDDFGEGVLHGWVLLNVAD